MKETALSSIHEGLGAKMVEFAGYNMPVQYEGVTAEHLAVRGGVGVFDVSHMGEFRFQGKNVLDLLQKITVNDVSVLEIGQAQYSVMCYPDGGIVDDLLIYRFEDHYMMVVNASNIEKDFSWISEHMIDGVELSNISDNTSLLAVQGPYQHWNARLPNGGHGVVDT